MNDIEMKASEIWEDTFLPEVEEGWNIHDEWDISWIEDTLKEHNIEYTKDLAEAILKEALEYQEFEIDEEKVELRRLFLSELDDLINNSDYSALEEKEMGELLCVKAASLFDDYYL